MKPAKIRDFVGAIPIVFDFSAATKQEVLEKLGTHSSLLIPGLGADEITRGLLDRERLGSTGIGDGKAIPHAKFPDLDHIVLLFVRSREGVPFDAVDQRPVHAFFLLLAPDNSSPDYLKVLARVSRLLKHPGFMEKILAAEEEGQIERLIIQTDESIP